MTIGEHIKKHQPDIYIRLKRMSIKWENRAQVERLMREVPGFGK